MPSNRQTRQQRHMTQVKQTPGSAQRGRKTTENVPGSGYRESQFIGGKKYYSPLSTDPDLSITGGTATTINVSGGALGGVGTGVSVHADLSGLDTDDHDNYVHVGNSRTITAQHIFTANVSFTGTPNMSDISITSPSSVYLLNHDSFAGFVANEHIDWTAGTNNAFLTTGTVGGGVATFTSVISPTITTAVSTALTLSPTTDLVLNPTDAILVGKSSPANVVPISSDPFTSGFTGSGWKIDGTSFETTNMTLRGTLSVYELLIQQVRATNGSIFVSSTGKVATVASQTSITFEDPSNHGVTPFAVNDILLTQRVQLGGSSGTSNQIVKRVFAKVTALNGVTATLGAVSGAPTNVSTIEVGDDFVRIGNSSVLARQGGIYLTADDSGAPFIDIFSGVSSYATWNSTNKVKARLGRLDGITDTDAGLSGSQTNYFGLYSDNVHLKGTIFSEDGTIGGWDISADTISAGTEIYLTKTGNLKIVGKTVGATRYGLFLYETNGHVATSDFWALFHDVDDGTNHGEFVLNYEGTNLWKFQRDGKLWASAQSAFEIRNNTVRIDADSVNNTALYYECYSHMAELPTNANVGNYGWDLGGIRAYVTDDGANSAGYNGQIKFLTGEDGNGLVSIWLVGGGNWGGGAGNGALTKYWKFEQNGESWNAKNVADWDTASDIRVKTDIESLTGAVNIISSLTPITYNFKEDFLSASNVKDEKRWGFSAQDFKSVIPEAVNTKQNYGYEDFHSINTSMLVPILVAAVKELKAEIDALKE